MPYRTAYDILPLLGSRVPVLCDQPWQRGYVLVPPGTAANWRVDSTRPLGTGSWVAAPEPGASRRNWPVTWAVLPDGSGTTAHPAELQRHLTAYLDRAGEATC
ncbi:hypothetical protein ACIQU6_30820 [Streptomyces sp. NPDC090442]|uniref:hypothetical protein n=1 Tax=Streptomyces sp. NPDC090442 TaxID=3365962 RepID=UPI00380A0073